MQPVIETKRYFNCLSCKKGVFWVEHLLNGSSNIETWGTWYCNECGEGHKGRVTNGCAPDEKHIHVELTGDKREWTSVLLKLEPNAGDVYFTVKGRHFTKHDGPMPKKPWYTDRERYFYNEHTCPTNYLQDVIEILQVMPSGEESTDPHGIFEYMGSAPLYTDAGRSCDDVQDRLQLFAIDSKLPHYCKNCKTINPSTYTVTSSLPEDPPQWLACLECGYEEKDEL